MTGAATLALAEVADLLAEFGRLRCQISVETLDRSESEIVISLSVPCEGQDALGSTMDSLRLFQELRYLAGLSQVRAFATEYGMDAEKLEALLPERSVKE